MTDPGSRPARHDHELEWVPGFVDIEAAPDVLAAALQTAHMLPPDRLIDLLRVAGAAIGAVDVSMWLIDYGQSLLKPTVDGTDSHGSLDGTLSVSGTTAGRVFARSESIESERPTPHRWVPLLDGTERLGVLKFEFPAALTTHRSGAVEHHVQVRVGGGQAQGVDQAVTHRHRVGVVTVRAVERDA